MSRNRSQCIIKKNSLTVSDKEKSTNQISLIANIDMNKLKETVNESNPHLLNISEMKKPVFKNIEKKYPSKLSKNMFIHERGQIMNCFNKAIVGDIDKHTQVIDFEKFLHQFKNEEEIRNLELVDILDIDYDKLNEIKTKATDFIDVTSSVIYEMEQKGEPTESELDLIMFFYQKIEEIKSNEINIQIFANNLEMVRGVSYNNNGVRIFFKLGRKI
jgi:hypothetical protein